MYQEKPKKHDDSEEAVLQTEDTLVIEQTEHGSVSVGPEKPQKGDVVTITPAPEEGYITEKVIVTGPDGETIEVVSHEDGTYTFVQPDGKATITVTFQKMAETPECPRDESCPMADFSDLDRDAWYHDGIHYCLEEGLMVGIGENTFAPNGTSTRAMIVAILWRMEGSPEAGASISYDDVKTGDWYAEAVRWADEEDVVAGYGNGLFGPNDPITRQQLAAILWRYMGSPVSDGSLSAFVDQKEISGWALPAMTWAVEQGLMVGDDGNRLNPQGQATRAEAATMLMHFCAYREK